MPKLKINKKMKLIKFPKISEMSVPCAMILSGVLSGLIIGLSVYLTTWVFFGGANNRTKLFLDTPQANKPAQVNTLTPEQIKQMQEAQKQRLQQAQQKSATVAPETATTTKK
jgi:membrane glycosyltransferase